MLLLLYNALINTPAHRDISGYEGDKDSSETTKRRELWESFSLCEQARRVCVCVCKGGSFCWTCSWQHTETTEERERENKMEPLGPEFILDIRSHLHKSMPDAQKQQRHKHTKSKIAAYWQRLSNECVGPCEGWIWFYWNLPPTWSLNLCRQ